MALKGTTTTKGVTVTDAYLKVDKIAGNKTEVRAHWVIMANSDSLMSIPGGMVQFTPDIASGADNFLAQAYNHMKTLPEFEGATDV